VIQIVTEDNLYVEEIKKAIEDAPKRNFIESVDLAINLTDVDMKIPTKRIKEEIILPKGRGKTVKVAVFGSGEFGLKAKEAADLVIEPEEIEELAKDTRKARLIADDHAFFIAEIPLMPVIGKSLGIVLGPRGKMPQPLPPQADPAPIINSLKNKVRIRSKDRLTFHVPVGTLQMSAEDIASNSREVLIRIESRLERGKMNIKSVFVKTTMGPSVKLM